MPIVMDRAVFLMVPLRRRLGRWSTPKIVIEIVGYWLTAVFADTRAWFITEASRHPNFSKIPLFYPLHRFFDTVAGTRLRAGLANAFIFPRSLYDLSAFPDVVRHRLFKINVFACLQRPNSS